MRAAAIAMVSVLAFASACHTRTAADPSQEETAAREVEQGDEKSSDGDDENAKEAKDGKKDADGDDAGDANDAKAKGAAHAAASDGTTAPASKAAKGKKKDGKGDDGIDPEDIEVSTSPQGLLKPGAEEQVRQKLGVDKGAGVGTALRKFQREHELPATGMLDHETVIKLGLEPSDIFEKAD